MKNDKNASSEWSEYYGTTTWIDMNSVFMVGTALYEFIWEKFISFLQNRNRRRKVKRDEKCTVLNWQISNRALHSKLLRRKAEGKACLLFIEHKQSRWCSISRNLCWLRIHSDDINTKHTRSYTPAAKCKYYFIQLRTNCINIKVI